jgi:hypothetical protein
MATIGSPRIAAAAAATALAMAASAVRAMPGPDPTAVVVPQALRAHVPMVELSGLAWAPSLDRYLVIVDDSIDTDDNERHGAFLLTLDRNGHLDPEPLPVEGVNAIDDAESLTAGPDATYYLLTSHSPNKKGKVKKARRQLLRLKLQDRRLQVTGALDLFEGKHDLTGQLEKLGLPKETPVDIEALAYHAGSLYLGFKAPLLPDGSAILLRIERPTEAFEKGKLTQNNLSVWGRVKLSVPPVGGGPAVSEGIADLLFGADGSLYLCANAPKGYPKDGGGALWRIAKPTGGIMQASLLRRFPGLKPEGVTTAPGGTALTVVFDRNSRDPLWTSWPLGK